MAGIKVRRTLDDRGFKKYMAFCESLKDGSNDAIIDTFKYKFAVAEGRIVPKGSKKKPLTEAGLSMGDFEKAFQGLVGAFLPHLDQDEQEFLGNVCTALDEKINGGDVGGAQDALKAAMRAAGGNPDAYEDDAEADDDDDNEAEEDDECPEGECKVDGECVPCDKEKDGDDDDDEDKPNSGDAEEECCGQKMTESRKFPENPYDRRGNPMDLDFSSELDGTGMFGDPESELDDYDDDAGGEIIMNQGFHEVEPDEYDRIWRGKYRVERIHDFRTASSFDQYFHGTVAICCDERMWNEYSRRGTIYMCYTEGFADVQPEDDAYPRSLMAVCALPDGYLDVSLRDGHQLDDIEESEFKRTWVGKACKPTGEHNPRKLRGAAGGEESGPGPMRFPLTSSANRIPGKRRGRSLTEGSGYMDSSDDYGELEFDHDIYGNDHGYEDEPRYDESEFNFNDDEPSSLEKTRWAGNCTVETIPDFQTAQEFARYFADGNPWFFIQDENAWNQFVNAEPTNVYFCYTPNFDNLYPDDRGYGQSLIAVIAREQGYVVLSRNRGRMMPSYLEKVIGGDPEEFLPRPGGMVDSINGLDEDGLFEGIGLSDDFDADNGLKGIPNEEYPTELDFSHKPAAPASTDVNVGNDFREPAVDYDALADDLLREAGYESMTVDNGGVQPGNRKFFGR